jgi:hypothetical protein
LIDLDTFDRMSMFTRHRYEAVFCERHHPSALQLAASIQGGGFGKQGQVQVHESRFEDVVPAVLRTLPPQICGVLFADPNGGISNGLIELFQAYRKLDKVDVVLWQQAALWKRFDGLRAESKGEGGTWAKHHQEYMRRPLGEVLPMFGKRHWLIRNPFSAGPGTRWTMLIGSNMPNLPEWEANSFYRMDSLRGQEILGMCDR